MNINYNNVIKCGERVFVPPCLLKKHIFNAELYGWIFSFLILSFTLPCVSQWMPQCVCTLVLSNAPSTILVKQAKQIHLYTCLNIAQAKAQTSKWSNIKTSSKHCVTIFKTSGELKWKSTQKSPATTTQQKKSVTTREKWKMKIMRIKCVSFSRRQARSRSVFLFFLNDKQKKRMGSSSTTAATVTVVNGIRKMKMPHFFFSPLDKVLKAPKLCQMRALLKSMKDKKHMVDNMKSNGGLFAPSTEQKWKNIE